MNRGRIVRIVLALVIGVGIPYVELALKCRVPDSEACVWGHAYLPLSRWVGVLVVAPIAYLVLSVAARALGHRHDP